VFKGFKISVNWVNYAVISFRAIVKRLTKSGSKNEKVTIFLGNRLDLLSNSTLMKVYAAATDYYII
tara:strand:- start:52514 stop:52711 length:198 start_codon:yes stop_codon:yes gene_type:complete